MLESRRWFERSPVTTAIRLIGCELRIGGVRARVTEVEAYAGSEDSASHARFGPKGRSRTMFESPGRAYVYLCYGVHNMLNVVAHEDDEAGAVLIRSCALVQGEALVARRRGPVTAKMPVSAWLKGPGNVGKGLGVDRSWDAHPLYRSGGLTLHRGDAPTTVRVGRRIGIDFSKPRDRSRRWRFACAEASHVSDPKGLRTMSRSSALALAERSRS